MSRIKLMGLALVAVFAFSAVAATVASAVEGPFWKVAGVRLVAGETRLLLATAAANFVLTANTSQTITCKTISLPVGSEMQIIGSPAKTGGRSLEALEFTGCTVANNGEKCLVSNGGVVKTTLVLNLLGYSTGTRTGPILVLFAPDVGKDFVTVSFTPETGGKCTLPSALVEGNVVGLERVGGVNVEVGAHETETLHGEVAFAALNKTIWLEIAGSLVSVKSAMSAFGTGAKFQGIALLLVDSEGGSVQWGVFTA
jgi:hypothetical protein